MMQSGDFSIFLCPKCGMISLVQGSCRICETLMIESGETVLSASNNGFTKTIHSIRNNVKSNPLFTHEDWDSREKTVRKTLRLQKQNKATTPDYKQKANFIAELNRICKEQTSSKPSQGLLGGLIPLLLGLSAEIKNAGDSLSLYVKTYIEARTAIVNDTESSTDKQASLKYLTKDFKNFINSLYLAGQQEGIDACNIFLHEIELS